MKVIFTEIFFRILRYEDFSMDIWNKTDDIFQFLGLDFTEESIKFLVDHTHKDKVKPEAWNTLGSY